MTSRPVTEAIVPPEEDPTPPDSVTGDVSGSSRQRGQRALPDVASRLEGTRHPSQLEARQVVRGVRPDDLGGQWCPPTRPTVRQVSGGH